MTDESQNEQNARNNNANNPAANRAQRNEQEDAQRKAAGLPPKRRSKDDSWREPGEPEVPYNESPASTDGIVTDHSER